MLTEFELIKHCFNWPQNNDNIIFAVGDDASIVKVPSGHELVQSIDTQVAGVHFPATAPAQLIAQRALRCALSDLAAMGATPQAFHLALSLPKNTSLSWAESFSSGLRSCSEEFNTPLIGGDTTSSPVVIVTIQVQGTVKSGKALRRNGAQAGDRIWTSGELGSSAAALEGILKSPENLIEKGTDLASAYYFPLPQIALGKRLENIATSAMDISDGLLQDACHIAKASHCQLNIESDKLLLNPNSVSRFGQQHTLQCALIGGDDYQLLFTAPATESEKLLALNCYEIGTVASISSDSCIDSHKDNAVEWVLLDGQPIQNKQQGYQHF